MEMKIAKAAVVSAYDTFSSVGSNKPFLFPLSEGFHVGIITFSFLCTVRHCYTI